VKKAEKQAEKARATLTRTGACKKRGRELDRLASLRPACMLQRQKKRKLRREEVDPSSTGDHAGMYGGVLRGKFDPDGDFKIGKGARRPCTCLRVVLSCCQNRCFKIQCILKLKLPVQYKTIHATQQRIKTVPESLCQI